MFLPDYQAFIPEAIAALQEREDMLAQVTLLADELREKQAAAGKAAVALGPAAAGDKRLAAANSSISALQVSRWASADLRSVLHASAGHTHKPPCFANNQAASRPSTAAMHARYLVAYLLAWLVPKQVAHLSSRAAICSH